MNMNFLKILLVLFALNISLYGACSGCIDAPLPQSLSDASQMKFTQLEEKIAEQIDQINEVLKEAINKTEEYNREETRKLLDLQKQKALKQEHKLFLQVQMNKVQSIINDVWSVENE